MEQCCEFVKIQGCFLYFLYCGECFVIFVIVMGKKFYGLYICDCIYDLICDNGVRVCMKFCVMLDMWDELVDYCKIDDQLEY